MDKNRQDIGYFFFFLTLATFFSCSRESGNKVVTYSNATFYEPTMIINYQGDNSMEGDYIRIKRVAGDTVILDSLPNAILKIKDIKNWLIGWGDGVKFKNTGSENLREIVQVIDKQGKLLLGKIRRGAKKPQAGDFVCFYNTRPSNYFNIHRESIYSANDGLAFLSKKSVVIAKVLYDKSNSHFVMFANEVDSDSLQTFVLSSSNLMQWHLENNGEPLIKGIDNGWNTLTSKQRDHYSAILTDVINYKGVWYFALTTIDESKRKQISIYSSSSLLDMNKQLVVRNAIDNRLVGREGGIFYPKLLLYNDRVHMYYTGIDKEGEEHIYGAFSVDMKQWKESYSKPFVYGHSGWRSETHSSEVAAVMTFSDTVVLFVQGAKAHNAGFANRYLYHNEYVANRGNVADSEIGMFFSIDGGLTFRECRNNPVFINDYSSEYENDHLGMSLDIINKHDTSFLFYSAKSVKTGKYQPFMKVRIKKG